MNPENTRAGSDGLSSTSSWKALATGAAGAATVTLAHEVVRQLAPKAPRMDRVGMAALARVLRRERRRGYTLVGDLAGNALFYAPLALRGRQPVLSGLALGALAGFGAVMLPPLLGLRHPRRGVTVRTHALTVALYTLGGLAAGATAALLDRPIRARALGGLEPQTGEW
jgi:hypothetical protein